MTLRTLLLLIFLSPAFCARSQSADTALRILKFGTTGIYNRTNEDHSFVLNPSLGIKVERKRLSLNSNSAYVYGKDESGLTNNDFSTSFDVDFLRKQQKLYYWALAAYESSYSLELDNRLQAGGGLGYTLVDTKNVYLILSDGPLFETITLADSSAYQTIRNSFRIKYKITFRDLLVLDGVNFIQNSVFDADDYTIRASNNLSLKVNKWLSFMVSTNYNRINVNSKENLLCNFGFRVETTF